MGSRTLPNHPKTLLVEARVEVGAVDTSAHGSHSAGRSKMVVQGMLLVSSFREIAVGFVRFASSWEHWFS